jgi:hypothetical protein
MAARSKSTISSKLEGSIEQPIAGFPRGFIDTGLSIDDFATSERSGGHPFYECNDQPFRSV